MRENYNNSVAAAPRIVIGAAPKTPIPPTKAAKKERISPEAEVMDEVSPEVEVMDEVTMTMHGHAVTAATSSHIG